LLTNNVDQEATMDTDLDALLTALYVIVDDLLPIRRRGPVGTKVRVDEW
jgi:hypothetical protein